MQINFLFTCWEEILLCCAKNENFKFLWDSQEKANMVLVALHMVKGNRILGKAGLGTQT